MLQDMHSNMKRYSHLDSSTCSLSSPNIFWFLHFFLCSYFFATANATVKSSNKTFPAMIVFGDSITDTGNNNYILTILKSNFRPYGINFPDGVPTGRFSDGKIPSDILGESLRIKPILPPYLDPKLKSKDLRTGVVFSSSGSGYDPVTPITVSVISMLEQLDYFQEYMQKLRRILGEKKTNSHLAKSLFFVVAGTDDIANTYFGLHARQLQYDVAEYTTFLADSATSFAMHLYGYGARKIAMTGMPPIGCLPSQRTLRGGLNRDCADKLNFAAQLYNSKLSTKLDALSKTLPSSKLVFFDIYTPLIRMMKNPKQYDFEVTDRGCCGTGYLEVGPLCNYFTSYVCNNVSAYLFWDSYHPTERAYRIISKEIIDKYMHLFFD